VATLAQIADSFFKPPVRDLVPYEPGKPVEEVQRELGLDRVVKLASNEGPFGPFPEAIEALAAAAPELNRYPDGGGYRLRTALAERHGVRFEEVALGAGADGVVDALAQISVEPGDEIVCGWPSFPSYVIAATKLGGVARTIPLVDGRYDLDAMLDAVTDRTKLVFVCHPNNPTGTMNSRAELDGYFERVPAHVVTVLDQAYFEYVDDSDYADGIEDYVKAGRRAIVLRTFSKIFGLAGLRLGYAVVHESLTPHLHAVQEPFNVNSAALSAGSASLERAGLLTERRELARRCRELLRDRLAAGGLEPLPSDANFVLVPLEGGDDVAVFERLARRGLLVRPGSEFGLPGHVRVTVGPAELMERAASELIEATRER